MSTMTSPSSSSPSSFVLLVALAATAIAGIHGNSDNNNNYGGISGRRACRVVARSCHLEFVTTVRGMNLQGRFPNIHQICQMAVGAQTCMGTCFNTLFDGGESRGRIFSDIADYACDEGRRDEMALVLQAPCFKEHGSGIFSIVFADIGECAEQAARNVMMETGIRPIPELICPVYENVRSCFAQNAAVMCGAQTIPFFDEIFRISARDLFSTRFPGADNNNCFDNADTVHSVVKRAADFLDMFLE